ncbi:MAG TPA: hypothetical protein VL096_09580, partial [Pirellulaceae bacterium]|nr:hypothetical protein [Pirellulaceae bacterium]
MSGDLGWMRSFINRGLWASGLSLALCAGDLTAADAVKPEIAALIEKLGSPHYASRERAAAELSQLGLEAFDALHAAQNDPDIEVAERARYLLHSMHVNWSRPGDSPDVKRLLKDYGKQTEAERRSLLEQLGALDDAAGLDALCRLARYEMSTTLAKEAALGLMSNEALTQAPVVDRLRKAVSEHVGSSDRVAAKWLVAYVRTLDDPASMADAWKRMIADERQLLVQYGDKQSSNKIVRDLYRWQAEYLQKLNRQDEAIDAVRQLIALSDGSREQLVEIIDWLMQRKAYKVVDEVADKHPARFAEDPLLTYRLAEAQ